MKDRLQVLKALREATGLMNHDQFQAAILLLEKVAREDPANPLTYKHLGLCYQRLGQFSKVKAALAELRQQLTGR
jgi:Flp pilus assembly protein TadD